MSWTILLCFWVVQQAPAPRSSALLLAPERAPFELTSPEEGVQFDLDDDGVPERVAWTPKGSELTFLAIDSDGDGRITSGKELIGTQAYLGAPNGFAALARLNMATNGGLPRGSVSSDDPLFAKLLLWTDSNHNGVSEPTELRPASELFAAIGLGYRVERRREGLGKVVLLRGWAAIRTAPGRNWTDDLDEQRRRKREVYEVTLAFARCPRRRGSYFGRLGAHRPDVRRRCRGAMKQQADLLGPPVAVKLGAPAPGQALMRTCRTT